METESKIFVDGATLHCFKHESSHPTQKSPLVLVNGFMRPSTDFRLLARECAANGIATYSFDNRGAGATIIDRPFSLGDMVSDVKSVLDHHRLDCVCLLGISMGGLIVQRFAATYPNLVSKLILVSTTCQEAFITLNRTWGNTSAEVTASFSKYVTPSFYERNRLLIEAMAKQVWRGIESGNFRANANMQHLAMENYNTMDLLSSISCPVLIIHGSEDRIISPKSVDVFKENLRDVSVKTYPECGHLILAERPKDLQKDVIDFVLNL